MREKRDKPPSGSYICLASGETPRRPLPVPLIQVRTKLLDLPGGPVAGKWAQQPWRDPLRQANAGCHHARIVGAELSKTALSGARTGLPCLRHDLAAGARAGRTFQRGEVGSRLAWSRNELVSEHEC
jgi:hypothetical protein